MEEVQRSPSQPRQFAFCRKSEGGAASGGGPSISALRLDESGWCVSGVCTSPGDTAFDAASPTSPRTRRVRIRPVAPRRSNSFASSCKRPHTSARLTFRIVKFISPIAWAIDVQAGENLYVSIRRKWPVALLAAPMALCLASGLARAETFDAPLLQCKSVTTPAALTTCASVQDPLKRGGRRLTIKVT